MRMGNEMADAVRDELYDALMREYGSLEAAAEVLSIPYKTLYRALTTKGKDRSQSVKLDFVMQITDQLEASGVTTFPRLYEGAVGRLRDTEPTDEQ